MARNALPSSTLSPVSTFKYQRNTAAVTAPPPEERNKETLCPDCKTMLRYSQKKREVGIPNPTKFALTAPAPVAGDNTRNALHRFPRPTYGPWKQTPFPRSRHFRQVEPVPTRSAERAATTAVVTPTAQSTSPYHPFWSPYFLQGRMEASSAS